MEKKHRFLFDVFLASCFFCEDHPMIIPNKFGSNWFQRRR